MLRSFPAFAAEQTGQTLTVEVNAAPSNTLLIVAVASIIALIAGMAVMYFLGRKFNKKETLPQKTERVFSYVYGKPVRIQTFTASDLWKWLERREWTGCKVLVAKVTNRNFESMSREFDINLDAREIKDKYLVVYIQGKNQEKVDGLFIKYGKIDPELEKTFDDNGTFVVEG